MQRFVQKSTAFLVSMALVFSGFAAMATVSAQDIPEMKSIFSIATVKVNDISRQELFDFITDIENDTLYYPGITETILIEEGDHNLVGTKYIQRGVYNDQVFDTTIDITRGLNGFYVVLKGESPALSYTSLYTFTRQGRNGALFTTTSLVNGYGLSTEFQEQFITYSYNQLLAVLGKTGQVGIPALFEVPTGAATFLGNF